MPPPVLLVIDDEPGMLALAERAVRPSGYRVVAHTSAYDGLASLSAEHPDVALIDLQMPELGGLDVLRAIRERQPQCGVILMTAHASVDTAIEAIKLGALDFSSRFGKQIDGVSPAAERILMSGTWAGNVRELRNTLERACMLADGSTLTERDVTGAMPAVRDVEPAPDVPTHPEGLEAVEREHIVRMLAEVRGNKLAAAKRLGISRRTLYRRLERHGLMETGGHLPE